MGEVEGIGPYLEPLRKSVVVARAPAEAFEIFTARLASWWPLARFSIHQAEAATCGIEPRVGGEVYELAQDGRRAVWGTVTAWDPPRGFVMTWHPGRDPRTAQEVELRFLPEGEGTRVELEHRGWAKLGAQARETRRGYEDGWAHVFEVRFVEACS
jgi:uncharacterized protein YndB with AHSA1/START domain